MNRTRKLDAKDGGASAANAGGTDALTIKGVAIGLLVALLALAMIFVAILHPIVQWERASSVGGQYYVYLTAFNKDLLELDWLNRQYAYTPLQELTFERKAAAAANFSTRAKEALTSWGYFATFIRQNEGPLRMWNVDPASALSKVENGRTSVRNDASAIVTQLGQFTAKHPDSMARVNQTIKTLRELGK